MCECEIKCPLHLFYYLDLIDQVLKVQKSQKKTNIGTFILISFSFSTKDKVQKM